MAAEAGQGLWSRLRNPARIAQPRSRRSEQRPNLLPELCPGPADCALVTLLFRMSFSSNLNHYGMVHVASVSDVLLDNSFTPPCQRMGGMVSFRTFEDFVRSVGLVCVATTPPELGEGFARSRAGFRLVLRVFGSLCVCPLAAGGAVCRQGSASCWLGTC